MGFLTCVMAMQTSGCLAQGLPDPPATPGMACMILPLLWLAVPLTGLVVTFLVIRALVRISRNTKRIADAADRTSHRSSSSTSEALETLSSSHRPSKR